MCERAQEQARGLLDELWAQAVRELLALELQQVAPLPEAAVSLAPAREPEQGPSCWLLAAHNIQDTVDDDASRSRPA